MKGKKYRTEEKNRILREADTGECTIAELCKEKNISEVTFHRWKREFGMMVGLLRDVLLLADFYDTFAAIGSPQDADLIFCRMSFTFHGLGPFWGPD